MTTPRQPADPPKTPSDDQSGPKATHGVPDGAETADSKGHPTSDRQKTETSPGRIEKSSG